MRRLALLELHAVKRSRRKPPVLLRRDGSGGVGGDRTMATCRKPLGPDGVAPGPTHHATGDVAGPRTTCQGGNAPRVPLGPPSSPLPGEWGWLWRRLQAPTAPGRTNRTQESESTRIYTGEPELL